MVSKTFIYIASPYTKGDPAINTHVQLSMFNRMMDDGVVFPFAPRVTHFQHSVFPRKYQDWIEYDLALLERFDGCLRLDASLPELDYLVSESSGADNEVKRFRELGKPVFFGLDDVYGWAKSLGSNPSECMSCNGFGFYMLHDQSNEMRVDCEVCSGSGAVE